MPDVTVREVYVNEDHFNVKNTAVYPFSGSGGSGVTGLQWSGTSYPGALGSYVDFSYIKPEQTLYYTSVSAPHNLHIGAGVGGMLKLGNTSLYAYDIYSANDGSEMYFGYYLTTMGTLNTTRWQFHNTVRVDDLAGTGIRLVETSADGDIAPYSGGNIAMSTDSQLSWGSTGDYIYGNDSLILVAINSTPMFGVGTNGVQSLGYYYLPDSTGYIGKDSADNMIFYDAVTATEYTLSQLVSGELLVLGSLGDVEIPSAGPNDGEVLTWIESAGSWQPSSSGSIMVYPGIID